MALIKYKVLQSAVQDGATYLPEKAIPIGVLPDAETHLPIVAFLMLYLDWAKEFPEEASVEVAADSAIASNEERKKGVADVK